MSDNNTIAVVSSGSGEPGIGAVGAAYEGATGCRVAVRYDDSVGKTDGSGFDVVVASADAMRRNFLSADLVEDGLVSIGQMALGVAIRRGAPVPDIRDVESFVRAVVATEAFIITTHTSGLYIEEKLKELGVFDLVEPHLERYPNGPRVMDRLLESDGMTVLSVNQVRRYEDRGLELVGLLPEGLQQVREFVAAPLRGSTDKANARAFVEFCGGAGKHILIENGFLPV